VAAEHHDHAALAPCGVGDRRDHGAKVPRHEHVGERTQEGAERAVACRRLREVGRADLVRPDRDRDRADAGEIDLARPAARV
jgi:hypothetical protein